MTRKGTGGSPQHDVRREGEVDPPEHNLGRGAGRPNPRSARLEDPARPHQPPSGRELRRAEERKREGSDE
jgi:hypothetical protein